MTVPDAYLREFLDPVGFLNHASVSPVSLRVRLAVDAVLGELAGADGDLGALLLARYEAALNTIGRFVGVRPEQVTVTSSTSAALFQVAFGLLGTEGNVVVPSHEFPANIYPWMRAEAVGGPELRLVDVPGFRVTPDALRDAVDGDTVAIAVSLVDFRSGFRVNVEDLAEVSEKALLVVDGVQGLGAVAQTLAPADVLCAGGQKFLRSGVGHGLCAVSERTLDRLAPTLTGWWGVDDAFGFDEPPPHEERPDAERLQNGSPAVVGAIGAAAAVETAELAGIDAIEAAVIDIVAAIDAVLDEADCAVMRPWTQPSERAGIVSFRRSGEDPAVTFKRLTEAGIVATHYGEWVRLSAHATTPDAVTGMLAEAL